MSCDIKDRVWLFAFLVLGVLSLYRPWLGYPLALIALWYGAFGARRSNNGRVALLVLIVFLFGIGLIPVRSGILEAGRILKDRLAQDVLSFTYGKLTIILTPFRIQDLTGRQEMPRVITETIDQDQSWFARTAESLVKREAAGNLLGNGDFQIPAGHPSWAWGHGFYSDWFYRKFGIKHASLIGFGGADVRMKVVSDDKVERAVQITHTSETASDSVGVMEQYIRVIEAGTYSLSFWYRSPSGYDLLFCTTKDWQNGPTDSWFLFLGNAVSDWQPFSRKVKLEQGVKVFSIVSKGKGEVYLADLKLIKD